MSCVDKETMLERVKRLTLRRLSDRLTAATVAHTNRDAYYSPSEWWYDSGRTQRHTLTTTAAWSMNGTTVTLTLNFTISTK